jgi:hypothetical protein
MKNLSLQRLGLCAIAAVIVWFYSLTAATIRLRFYLPIGLMIMTAYVWFVAFRCKSVYPKPAKAIGQLCFTFLWVGLAAHGQLKGLMNNLGTSNMSVEGAAELAARSTISSNMTMGLFVLYLIFKRKEKKLRIEAPDGADSKNIKEIPDVNHTSSP